METTGEEGSKQQKATGTGWEWKADTQKWVESSGKPPFRIVPDDTKPTLRDPLSTADLIETEHILLRPPPFNQ
ncbi:unnamed protein product [Sphagnum troendelagicum]|uniref:Uncharacterized protein n=2 Tax=Sphagnum TaxID=13804 RepID=A0ABP0UUF5_9BRYO